MTFLYRTHVTGTLWERFLVVYGCGRNVPVTMVKRSCGMITIGKLMDYYGKRVCHVDFVVCVVMGKFVPVIV